MVDTSEINKVIRKILFPTLKDNGFSKVNLRKSWGYHDQCIWAFHLQTGSDYSSQLKGISALLGIYYDFIPESLLPKIDKDEKLIPEEWRCHVRNVLCVANLDQSRFRKLLHYPSKANQETAWWIEPDGSNLAESIEDIKLAFLTQGLQWFDNFSNLEYAFQCIDRLAPGHMVLDHINADGIPVYTGKAYIYGGNAERHFAQYLNYQDRVEAYSTWEEQRKLEYLERVYQMKYALDTFSLSQCLDFPCSSLDSYGDSFEDSGFIFTRTRYPGHGARREKYWKISKPDD